MSIIKLINKAAVNILIKNGYVNSSKYNGITVASKNKQSSGKSYYAENSLAFKAWELLGENPDDKDFQNWKKNKERTQKRQKSTD